MFQLFPLLPGDTTQHNLISPSLPHEAYVQPSGNAHVYKMVQQQHRIWLWHNNTLLSVCCGDEWKNLFRHLTGKFLTLIWSCSQPGSTTSSFKESTAEAVRADREATGHHTLTHTQTLRCVFKWGEGLSLSLPACCLLPVRLCSQWRPTLIAVVWCVQTAGHPLLTIMLCVST